MITPILKPKKISLKGLIKKADKAFQEWGRDTYKSCLICGGAYSCLHHFIHKSQSTNLRWDMQNGVPVCQSCHCRIHSRNNPIDIFKIKTGMERLWGVNWEFYIRSQAVITLKPNRKYLENKINEYEQNIPS